MLFLLQRVSLYSKGILYIVTALYNNMCYDMTRYIDAGCYVNRVLGYDNICYVNMLHVLSCTFLHENNIQTKTEIQDIQPSTRPRINMSQVLAGKSCIYVLYVCLDVLIVVSCFYVCFVRL